MSAEIDFHKSTVDMSTGASLNPLQTSGPWLPDEPDHQRDTPSPSAQPQKTVDLPNGFQIAEYTVTGILGKGAMGTVYAAEDGTGHEVALKLFREEVGHSRTLIERFRREAEAAKKLRRHPYILTVYNSGKEDTTHFMAMEKIADSLTLERLISTHKISGADMIRLGSKIASALSYAHEHGILHRDVKPANIMVDEFGDPRLADFGVAELQEWPSFTAAGILTGTPLYMSPEQAQGKPLDGRSDVYSLAVVIYEAITRRYPYNLPADIRTKSVLQAVRYQRATRPRKIDASISRDTEYVLLKALGKNPDERYRSARAFENDLLLLGEGRPIPSRFAFPFAKWMHRLKRFRLLLTILLVIGALSLIGWIYLQAKVKNQQEANLLQRAAQRNVETKIQRGLPFLFYQQGRRSMETGDIEAAMGHFTSVENLQAFERIPRLIALSQVELARCHYLKGQHEQSMGYYQAILQNPKLAPSATAKSLLDRVVILIDNRDIEGARQLIYSLGSTLGNSPQTSLAAYLVGEMEESRFSQAMQLAPPAFRNDVQVALAVREYALGRKDSARKLLEDAAPKNANNFEWPEPLRRTMLKRFDGNQPNQPNTSN